MHLSKGASLLLFRGLGGTTLSIATLMGWIGIVCASSPSISSQRVLSASQILEMTNIPYAIKWAGTFPAAAGKIVDLDFLFYQNGIGGVPLWRTTRSVSIGQDGSYTAYLGATDEDPIPSFVFKPGGARWIEVRLNDASSLYRASSENSETLKPAERVLLSATPYAFQSLDSDSLAGRPAGDYVTHDELQAEVDRKLVSATPRTVNSNDTESATGSIGFLPAWDSSLNLEPSVIYQSDSMIGINTTSPAAMLDVNGESYLRGNATLVSGGASQTNATNSPQFIMQASGYSQAQGGSLTQKFALQAISGGNNSDNPTASLSFLSASGSDPLTATGLSIAPNGVITFVPGQTLPLISGNTSIGGDLNVAGALTAETSVAAPTMSVTTEAGAQTMQRSLGGLQSQLNPMVCGTTNPPAWCSGSDFGVWVNAAYAALPATGGVLNVDVPNGGITYRTPIVFDTRGKYVLLRCSSVNNNKANTIRYMPTSGAAITFNLSATTANAHPNFYGTDRCPFQGAGGDSTTNTSIGLYLGGTNGAEGFVDTGGSWSQFGSNVQFGDNTWKITFIGTEFGQAGGFTSTNTMRNMYFPTGLTNSGEEIRLIGVTFLGGGKRAVELQPGGEFTGIGVSFDDSQLLGAGTKFGCDGCHFEDAQGDQSIDAPEIDVVNGNLTLISPWILVDHPERSTATSAVRVAGNVASAHIFGLYLVDLAAYSIGVFDVEGNATFTSSHPAYLGYQLSNNLVGGSTTGYVLAEYGGNCNWTATTSALCPRFETNSNFSIRGGAFQVTADQYARDGVYMRASGPRSADIYFQSMTPGAAGYFMSKIQHSWPTSGCNSFSSQLDFFTSNGISNPQSADISVNNARLDCLGNFLAMSGLYVGALTRDDATFKVDGTTGNTTTVGNVAAESFTGTGTGLTGTAVELSIGGNAATATKLKNDGVTNYVWTMTGASAQSWAPPGVAPSVTNSVVFDNRGEGVAPGTQFDGSAPVTVSYNTLGAASVTGIGASGTWGISVTGTASNVSGTPVLPNGTTATTQTAGDTSGKLATDAFVASALSGVPAWLQYLGDGSDGANTNASGNMGGDYNFTDFTLPSGNTVTVNAPIGLVVHATGTCTIAGSIIANGATYPSSVSVAGLGGGNGGGGGGGINAASDGAVSVYSSTTTSPVVSAAAGGSGEGGAGRSAPTSGQSILKRVILASGAGTDGLGMSGSSGGSGGSSYESGIAPRAFEQLPNQSKLRVASGFPGAAGGAGGLGVVFMCGTINFSGSIDASGAPGMNSFANYQGAGGGGGGGVVIMRSPNWTASTGNINVSGGRGGECRTSMLCGNGGSGSDGWYMQIMQ